MFFIGTAGQLHLAKGAIEVDTRHKQIHYAFNVKEFDNYLNFLTDHKVEYGDFAGTPGAFQTRPDGTDKGIRVRISSKGTLTPLLAHARTHPLLMLESP